jgi:hypothetical protein
VLYIKTKNIKNVVTGTGRNAASAKAIKNSTDMAYLVFA